MLNIVLVYFIHSVHSLFKIGGFFWVFFNTFILVYIAYIDIYIYISDIVSPFSGSVTAILALTLK